MASFWASLPKPILALAPMEGVTDQAFRQVCKDFGADVLYTEFVSSDAIVHGAKPVIDKLRFDHIERPIVAQIFGRDPKAFAVAAKKVAQLGFDGLDINLGCPARKVVRTGSGAALLRDPQFARQLIVAAGEACDLPISLKIRASIRREPGSVECVTAVDFMAAIQDLPIAAIMVHGRSFEGGHSGEVDLDMIRQVKACNKAIVLANGGLKAATDIPAMLARTSADGVGIARGAWGQPWIFAEARVLLQGQASKITPLVDRRVAIIKHAQLVFDHKGDHGLIEFRKHLARYITGFPGAAELRYQAVRISSLTAVKALVDKLPTV